MTETEISRDLNGYYPWEAFCGTREGCPVWTWNPMESKAEFFRTAKQVEIKPSGGGD